MTEAEIYVQLTELFHAIFNRDDINLTSSTTARDIAGWDSFKQIDIIVAVEQHFNLKFRIREVDALHSVGDLVIAISRKLGNS